MQLWMPAILSLFGSLLVVVVTGWLNTKALSSQIDLLRAEMKQSFAEFRLEIHSDMVDVKRRVERLEGLAALCAVAQSAIFAPPAPATDIRSAAPVACSRSANRILQSAEATPAPPAGPRTLARDRPRSCTAS